MHRDQRKIASGIWIRTKESKRDWRYGRIRSMSSQYLPLLMCGFLFFGFWFLQAERAELENNMDEQHLTAEDRLQRENVRVGRDKYKTLRDIRKGNTKRRVDQFENL